MAADGGYLIVLGDREPIAWVLAKHRMAFPPNRAQAVAGLAQGTPLVLYATRGAYHNPTAHRGRAFGLATVTSPVAMLAEPVQFGERSFTSACKLAIEALAPLHGGVELEPLVPRLHAFPKKYAWSVYLRRPLVHLDESDLKLLTRKVSRVATLPEEHLHEYLAAGGQK